MSIASRSAVSVTRIEEYFFTLELDVQKQFVSSGLAFNGFGLASWRVFVTVSARI